MHLSKSLFLYFYYETVNQKFPSFPISILVNLNWLNGDIWLLKRYFSHICPRIPRNKN